MESAITTNKSNLRCNEIVLNVLNKPLYEDAFLFKNYPYPIKHENMVL
jgi:hypothetical protein